MFESKTQVLDYLSRITSESRVPHALLVLGPEGSGQLQIVLQWCKMLFCTVSDQGSFCNQCKACRQVEQLVHPDLHFAFPVIKHEKFKREETTSIHFLKEWRSFVNDNVFGNLNDWLSQIDGLNKNANINVAECNQIIQNLSLKSFSGKYKIQIIWHAESLAREGNRLLKLIEEPADDTVIILIANDANAILNTIKSRCQILRIPGYSDDEIKEFLQENYQINAGQSEELAYLSNGNLRKAIEMSKQNNQGFSDVMLDWYRHCYTCDPEQVLKTSEYLAGLGRSNLKTFMAYNLHFLREYLQAYLTGTTEGTRLSGNEQSVILKMQKILDRNKTEKLKTLINKNIAFIDRNVSLKVMLMDMSLKINEILRQEVNKFA